MSIGKWRANKAQEREEAERAAALARKVYDVPPMEGEAASMREAMGVEHGTPWLRAVVDVGRQMQRENMEIIAGRPGTPAATEAGFRYSELVRFEYVLLGAVDQARVNLKA